MKPLDEKTEIGSLIPYYLQNIEESSINGQTVQTVKEPWRFNTISKFGNYESLAATASVTNDPFLLNGDTNYYKKNSYKFAIPDE